MMVIANADSKFQRSIHLARSTINPRPSSGQRKRTLHSGLGAISTHGGTDILVTSTSATRAHSKSHYNCRRSSILLKQTRWQARSSSASSLAWAVRARHVDVIHLPKYVSLAGREPILECRPVLLSDGAQLRKVHVTSRLTRERRIPARFMSFREGNIVVTDGKTGWSSTGRTAPSSSGSPRGATASDDGCGARRVETLPHQGAVDADDNSTSSTARIGASRSSTTGSTTSASAHLAGRRRGSRDAESFSCRPSGAAHRGAPVSAL